MNRPLNHHLHSTRQFQAANLLLANPFEVIAREDDCFVRNALKIRSSKDLGLLCRLQHLAEPGCGHPLRSGDTLDEQSLVERQSADGHARPALVGCAAQYLVNH
eukprot:scaffold3028_cov484-Prasinococcus_capsulatus_cf.AAC.1